MCLYVRINICILQKFATYIAALMDALYFVYMYTLTQCHTCKHVTLHACTYAKPKKCFKVRSMHVWL